MKRMWIRLGAAGALSLGLQCTEAPFPPESSFATDGLVQDSLGIWQDTLTKTAFADMPPAMRELYQYCMDCHSLKGTSSRKDSALSAVSINSWKDLVAFGPERFLLKAKLGDMPPDSSEALPLEVLSRAEAYIASWAVRRKPIGP